uniref:BED-type domain-containing protein n=1 Tax=Globodera rostochiensis TaxID=31243 RepID=A0A914HWH8_GLORO
GPEVSQNECVNGPPSSDAFIAVSSSLTQQQQRHHCPSSTIDPSSSSPDTSGTGAAGQSGLGQQPQKQFDVHRCHAQLSPAASIAAEVQRVSIDDRGRIGVFRLSPQMVIQQPQAVEGCGGRQAEEGISACSPEAGRTERVAGRALRKHAAVEDEEQPLLESGANASGYLPPAHSVATPSGVCHQPSPVSLSALLSADQQLAIAAASVVRPSPQRSNALPPLVHRQQQLDSVAAALQLALLQHQPQQQQQMHQSGMATVKMEPQPSSSLSREEMLSSLIHSHAAGRDQLLAAATVLQQQQHQNAMNALASLSAIMQQQQSPGGAGPVVTVSSDLRERELSLEAAAIAASAGPSSRLASIQEEQTGGTSPGVDIQRLFEAAGRNQSTESTASTSGGSAAPSGSAASGGAGESGGGIPRKQDIQTDIRMNRGRFQLVRKRGRSEVWNLFGQVVDMLTGQRLPYVACYACKVLYTDTGGGTGNMTRHRCSMGSSYRSVRRSSSDTTVGNESVSSINQSSSSFESIGGIGAVVAHGPISPQEEVAGGQIVHFRGDFLHHQNAPRTPTVGAAREAFAQSGSSGFLSGSTTSVLSTPASTSLDSSGTAQQYHQLHLNLGPPPMLMMSRFAAATASGSTAHPIPTGSASSTLLSPFQHQQQPNQSHSISPSTLTSPSSSSVPPTSTRTPLLVGFGSGHHFTPADKQLFVQAMVQFCAQDMHSCDVVEGEGFKNLIETVLFIGRRSHGDPSANTFDPVRNLIPVARQLKQTFVSQEVAVRQATVRDLSLVKDAGVALSCQTMNFGGERHLAVAASYITDDWRITRRTLRVEKAANMTQLGQLLVLLTMDSSEFGHISEVIGQMPNNVLLMPNANRALNTILAQSLKECVDFAPIFDFIRLCFRLIGAKWRRAMKEYATEISALLEREGFGELVMELRQINWQTSSELEQFLEPFHETAEIFMDSKQPHFQRIVPEWFALMHECQPQQSMDEPLSSSTGGTFSSLGQKMPNVLDDVEELAEKSVDGEKQQPREPFSPSQSVTFGTPTWLRSVSQAASRRLSEWAETNLRTEHRVATVLNPRPRLRQLQLICTEGERAVVYERIRELVGLSHKSRPAEAAEMKNEPFKKRRRFQEAETAAMKRKDFLHRLEDCAMEEEDELDIYLRTSFTQDQTQDILEFWSSIGEAQFPRLAHLARFILASSGAPASIVLQQPSTSKLGPREIGTLLNLRPEVLNSLIHRPHHQHHQSQQVQQQLTPLHQQSASPME